LADFSDKRVVFGSIHPILNTIKIVDGCTSKGSLIYFQYN